MSGGLTPQVGLCGRSHPPRRWAVAPPGGVENVVKPNRSWSSTTPASGSGASGGQECDDTVYRVGDADGTVPECVPEVEESARTSRRADARIGCDPGHSWLEPSHGATSPG